MVSKENLKDFSNEELINEILSRDDIIICGYYEKSDIKDWIEYSEFYKEGDQDEFIEWLGDLCFQGSCEDILRDAIVNFYEERELSIVFGAG